MDFWLLVSDSLALLFFVAMLNAFRRKEVGKFFTSFFIVLLTVWLIKLAFKIPRPVGSNYALDYGYSFISGHAALAFMSLYFIRDLVVLWVWPIAIALARLKLGVHRLIDVLLGAVYGFFIPYLLDKEWNRLKRNFFENENEFLRKLLHLAYYLTYPFFALYDLNLFYVWAIVNLVFLFILHVVKGEVIEHPLIRPFRKIKRKNESLLHLTYFPLLSLILALFFSDPKIIAFVGLTFAVGDSLVGLLNILIRRYGISLAIASFYLFLIVSVALNLKFGLLSVLALLIGDYVAKQFGINDNYTIPLTAMLIYFIF